MEENIKNKPAKKKNNSNYTSSKNAKGVKNNSSKDNAKKNVNSTNNKKLVITTKQEEIEILDKTNSFDIIIDDERLKDKESLDVSFVDGKKKKKKVLDEIELLETIDYKEEAKKLNVLEEDKRGKDIFSTALIIILSFMLGFLICFIWAKQSDYFVTVEKKQVEVVKTVIDENVVFLGDSIFERYNLEKFYPGMSVVNSGVSGNTSEDLLNNMNRRVYRFNPSKVVILIGTNDYRSISNESTVENISKIIDGIKENRPHSEIYVQSIYPVNKKVDEAMVDKRNNEDIQAMNKEIENVCKETEVTFINIYKLLVDESGNLDLDYTDDGLHINDSGYEVITKELLKVIKK